MERTKNKILKYISGIAVSGGLIAGLYYFYKNFNNDYKLNKWLTEYQNEVIEMIRLNKEKEMPLELMLNIKNLASEIADYLFITKHYELEEKRLSSLDNSENVENSGLEYQYYFAESLEMKANCEEKAKKIILKNFNVDLDKIYLELEKVDIKHLKSAERKAKKPFYESEINMFPQSIVKEAYVHYVKQREKIDRVIKEQLYILSMNPDYKDRALTEIWSKKFILSDELKNKFGLEKKYFDQLINKYDLLKDSEVRYYYELDVILDLSDI